MARIKLKPLSVNEVWAGRRFKTPKYKAYEQELWYILPKLVIPPGKLFLRITWGVLREVSDIDNPLKPFLDVLQKKYSFNDKMIYKLEVNKVIVKKGEEYIDFELSTLTS